ncbi:MAG: hypothetical protein RIK87_06240 [Fuerstiella sp.]
MVRPAFSTGPLSEKMSEDLHLTDKAKRTHDGYLREIRQLAEFCEAELIMITLIGGVRLLNHRQPFLDSG